MSADTNTDGESPSPGKYSTRLYALEDDDKYATLSVALFCVTKIIAFNCVFENSETPKRKP